MIPRFVLLCSLILGVTNGVPQVETKSPSADLRWFSHPCPVASVIHPCKCTSPDGEKVDLICDDINYSMGTSIEDIFHHFKEAEILELTIHQSGMKELMGKIFRNMSIGRLQLTNVDYERVSFTDDTNGLEKLSKSLYKIQIERANSINQWDWSGFESLKFLTALSVKDSPIKRLTKSFSALPDSITLLTFTKIPDLTSIAEGALARLHKLSDLKISETSLQTFERNVLPMPATNLVRLDLSSNKIQTLPSNFLEQMPRLKVLDLRGNQIRTLVPSTFQPITTQIDILLLGGNPYLCNCMMKWLIDLDKSKFHSNHELFCAEPTNLEGERILNLQNEDLVCEHAPYSALNLTASPTTHAPFLKQFLLGRN